MRPKNVVRLDHTHSVLAIARGVVDDARDQATKDAAALGSIYSDLFDRFDVRSCSVGQTGWRLVVATKDVVPELGPGDTIVWGMPIGERGPLSEEEVASVRADPTRAREIVGSYVLVFIADESIDLVVSASLPHLLTRTDGPLGTALATRSLAGHALTGRRPEIRPAAVVELLLYDYVLGDSHSLDGVQILEEATVHVLTRNGLRSESYWPRTERFAHGPESTAEGFIDLLTTTGVRLASARSAWLGLTGGRDSTLLAACLHQARVTIPTFTWGWVGDADADAAARTAQQLGWPHHVLVGRPNPDVEPYAYLVDQSAWHEGREPANNFIPAFINWPTDAIWWLTGNGGEIGRAFYWHSAPDDVHKAPVAWLMRGSLGMPQGRRRELKDRLDAEFERINSFGRPAEDALDVFYALQRMRKWMPQSPPNQPVRGQLGGYLEPSIVRTLLAVPHSARRDGSFFDEAIARVFPDFRVVTSAQKAGPRSLRSQLGRLRGHLNLARPRAAPIAEGIGTVAEALLARPSGDSSFTSSVMGNRWWNAAVNRSRRTGDLRWLWNALSIDAFAELTRRL